MRMERFLKNISLDELGLKTGIDQAKLSRIERGYKIPKDEEKTKIASVLNCTTEKIFGGNKNGVTQNFAQKTFLKIQVIKLLLDENQIELAKKEVEAILNLLNE